MHAYRLYRLITDGVNQLGVLQSKYNVDKYLIAEVLFSVFCLACKAVQHQRY